MKEKKISLEELIEKVDAAKKTNPLDLSSDQDLSLALIDMGKCCYLSVIAERKKRLES